MKKPLLVVGIARLVGLGIGVWTGLGLAEAEGCLVDGFGFLPRNATCYRIFGYYVSDVTYYAATYGLGGMGVALTVGFLFVTALRRSQRGPLSS